MDSTLLIYDLSQSVSMQRYHPVALAREASDSGLTAGVTLPEVCSNTSLAPTVPIALANPITVDFCILSYSLSVLYP